MESVFVTGVDTDVGKTIISAGILKLLHGFRKVRYWKPVQTGTIIGSDTETIQTLTSLPKEQFLDSVYRFPEAVSPHLAAAGWNKTIEMDALLARFGEARGRDEFLVVEGAGGVLVPLNDKQLMVDFIQRLGIPAVIVAQDRVGAINHTLLTVNALRERNIPIAGVVLSRFQGGLGNREAIERFGGVEVLAEIPAAESPATALAFVAGNERLRDLFGVPRIP